MQLRAVFPVSLLISLGACSTLPNSGPTGVQVQKAVTAPDNRIGISLVEVDSPAALPAPQSSSVMTLKEMAPPPTDMVGSGDVLSIAIYEAGVSLFANGASSVAQGDGFDTSARGQTFPAVRVDDTGSITLPYAGRLHVIGKTVNEIGTQVRNALRGYSQNPQVLVSLRETVGNSVIVSGEVVKPGRLVLQTNREALTDAIALSGGYRGNAKDLVLRITRQGETVDLRFSDLIANPALDVRAYPGDRLTLVSSPYSYSVLGASGKVDQLSFNKPEMSLAEAMASAGGASASFGDPKAVFVFRYEKTSDGVAHPVVYHFNMMQTQSYFLSQKFVMRNQDILYFGNARANQPTKLVQLISQLFSPILTVTSAVQTVQNSR